MTTAQHNEPALAQPQCPTCRAQGIEHFASQASNEQAKNGTAWFYVVYCSQCGHVYDVISKHSFNAAASKFVMPDLRR